MKSLALAVVVVAATSRAVAGQGFPLTLGGPALPPAPGVVFVEVTLRIDPVLAHAPEVVRLVRSPGDRSWRLAETSHPTTDRLQVRAAAGQETLLILTTATHPGYVVDGPFRWPDHPSFRTLRGAWRRTVRGRQPASGALPLWLSPDGTASDPWPQCLWTSGSDWECVAVPLDAGGVVVSVEPARVFYSLAPGSSVAGGVERVATLTAAWGRMLIVERDDQSPRTPGTLQVTARRLLIPRARPQTGRVEATADARVHVDAAGGSTFWISGREAPDDGWIEIREVGRATERVNTLELSVGPAGLPVSVHLPPPATVIGRVTAGIGVPAEGAIVTLYRFEPRHGDNDKRTPARRVSVGEARADQDGGFRFGGLAAEPYEVVAIDPALGRGVRQVDADGQPVEIALRRASQVTGRVLRDGAPAPGVAVAVLPDLAQFAAAADVTEVRGGETRTDVDGRFVVALASRGAGELRIGDERSGVHRVPLGPAETQPPLVDIGTIELGAVAPTIFVFEGSDACDLLITGPIGRTGLAVVRAVRLGPALFQADLPEAGRWQLAAVCGGRERPVVPSAIDVVPRGHDVTIRLTWPR